MPYDLYGKYYASARDAENAEMAQCASIDADIANRKVRELERKMFKDGSPYQQDKLIVHLSNKIQELESRLYVLETKTSI